MFSKLYFHTIYHLKKIFCYFRPILDGRRIINIAYFFEKTSKINHQPFDCTFKNLVFVKENRNGFYSEFLFNCTICNTNEIIESENPNTSLMDVNTASVTALVNSGQGYAQLDIFTALLNMPNMSNKMYQKLHGKVDNFAHNTAWESMSSAAEEEAKLAKDNGDVNENGQPMITVIADGAWSKRSYRTNYNALSGVVSKNNIIHLYITYIFVIFLFNYNLGMYCRS